MARTARKRPDTEKAPNGISQKADDETKVDDTAKPAEPTADVATPTQSDDDPVANLKAAYWHAIDERDVVTGTIPAAPLDAVKVAYRAVPKRTRSEVATALGAEAAQRMIRPDGVDAGLAVAMGNLSALFAQVNAERSVRSAEPHDPVPGIAGLLAALDMAREGALANLTDDQRERIGKVDVPTDPAALATGATTLTALAKIGTRVLTGRNRPRTASTGERSGGLVRDLGQLIRDAVTTTTDPITLAAIARDHDVSTGALDNRWTKENTDGVRSVRDTKGRKAFEAA